MAVPFFRFLSPFPDGAILLPAFHRDPVTGTPAPPAWPCLSRARTARSGSWALCGGSGGGAVAPLNHRTFFFSCSNEKSPPAPQSLLLVLLYYFLLFSLAVAFLTIKLFPSPFQNQPHSSDPALSLPHVCAPGCPLGANFPLCFM